MKLRIILLTVTSALLISACSTPASLAEEVTAPEVVTEMEESAAGPVLEESTSIENPTTVDDAMVVVSFSNDVWPILEKYALAAHGGKGGVFLESYSDILDQVVPGNPEASLLYKALIGDGMKQMPPGNPLPDEMIQMIYDWIEQGAKEN